MLKLINFFFFNNLILPLKFRFFSLFIILVIFLGFFAELFSIGLIVPLMTALFDGDKLTYYLGFFPDYFDFSNYSQSDFIQFFLLLILFVYFLKILIIFFQNYFIAKYCLSLGLYIQNKMIKNYLKKSIDFYNNNSSILIKIFQLEIIFVIMFLSCLFFDYRIFSFIWYYYIDFIC